MTAFSIESAAGVIPLVSTPGEEGPYRLGKGTTGLGLPPDLVRTVPSAAGGGTVRSHRVGMRDATLVIGTQGSSRADTEARLRHLARVIDNAARPSLVATIPGAGVYRLPFVRVGGGEDGYDDGGDNYVDWALEVRCVKAYWIAVEPVQFDIRQSEGDTIGLLPDLAALNVMAAEVSGSISVVNPGDAPARISFRIEGPGGVATVNVAGRGFTVGPLGAGQLVDIRHSDRGWKVTDENGAPAYTRLGPAPKFPSAPIGAVTGVASIADPGEGATIAGWFQPLRKLVH